MGKFGTRVLVVGMFVSGCSKPRNVALPADVTEAASDSKIVEAVKKLPEDEKSTFAAYVMRATLAKGFGKPLPAVATIGDAIEAQNLWVTSKKAEAEAAQAKEKEKKEIAAKAIEKQAAARKAMDDILTAVVTAKEFLPSSFDERRFEDVVQMKVAFKNKSSKPLKGVKGTLKFFDIFDDFITGADISLDKDIPANDTLLWTGSLKINDFKAADKKLAVTPLEKMKTQWLPHTYLFADGTSMKAGESPSSDD